MIGANDVENERNGRRIYGSCSSTNAQDRNASEVRVLHERPVIILALPETLKIPYPEELLTEFGETPEEFEREMRVLVAAQLYETGRITSGRAAEMAGMERVSFLNKLEHYDVSIINYSAEELEREIKEAQRRARDG